MRETYTNIEEAISGFGLDFTVEKTPLYTKHQWYSTAV